MVPAKGIRRGGWHFEGNGRDVLGDMHVEIDQSLFASSHNGTGMALKLDGQAPVKMRLRTWPVGNTTVDFSLNPDPNPARPQSVIGREGWSDGVNINLLPDGRLEVVRDGGDAVLKVTMVSNTKLPFGKWSRVRVTNDSERLRLYINGHPDAEKPVPAARSYGNSTWYLGGGYRDYANYRGYIDELTVLGAAVAPDDPVFRMAGEVEL